MKSEYTIQVRVFPVQIRDNRTGETTGDTIVLDKDRLRAAAESAGMDTKELICRIYGRQGFKVLEIGEPEKRAITVDLAELLREGGNGQ